MSKYRYVLLHGGKEPKLMLGDYHGIDIHIPIPPEISLKQIENEPVPPAARYETYKFVGSLFNDIDVYEKDLE